MDAQDSPDRARGGRQQQYDSAFLHDSDDSQARHYNWVQICLISAMGLAVGVMGTAAYVIWFSRDQVAYAEAVQSAHRPVSATTATTTAITAAAASAASPERVPSHAAVPTSAVWGRITPAAPTQQPAPANTDALASTQASDDEMDADADTADPPQAARAASAPNSAAARADRGRQSGSAARHAQRAKPKETFVSRLTAMFRKVGYHRRTREPGNNPDPYSHP